MQPLDVSSFHVFNLAPWLMWHGCHGIMHRLYNRESWPERVMKKATYMMHYVPD